MAKKLYSAHSKISGTIEVVQDGVERRLLVNGATQSILRLDGSERGYWLGLIPDQPVWLELIPNQSVARALILGLGGGTAARLLRKKWPGVKIVAYEVDPEVVRVASSFFNLDPKTEIRIDSAESAFRGNEKYDLVIVDTYLGYEFLPRAESVDFVKSVHDLLEDGGVACFNRVNVYGSSLMKEFEAKLRSVFREVWAKQAKQNLIFWGRK